MREILFGGKRTDNNEWVEGYYDCITDNHTPKNRCYITTFKKLNNGEIVLTGRFEVVPETVGQLVTVINGTKIFEGNILRCEILRVDLDYEHPILDMDRGTFRLPEIKTIVVKNGVVKWCEDLSEFRIHFYMKSGQLDRRLPLHDNYLLKSSIIVVGNMYDNPELLKGGAE